MDGRKHPAELDPTWFGHSIGHWEDKDTLVIDTVGFNDKFWFDRKGTPHTEQLHTIERWTRPNMGTLVNTVTIDDPGAYSQAVHRDVHGAGCRPPATRSWRYICQENNQYGRQAATRTHSTSSSREPGRCSGSCALGRATSSCLHIGQGRRHEAGSRRTFLGATASPWCVWRAATVAIGADNAGPPPMTDDVFKSVTVLQGIPVDTFFDAMGMFANAMGNDCTFCHAPTAALDRAFAEVTPRMQRARGR